MELDAFATLAERLADLAGATIRPFFRAALQPIDKADGSPVTQADRAAEKVMREALREAVPEHGIIGEEFGAENADAEWVWVLDPIDGTKAFITGKPLFTTLIALLHRGTPAVGVIDQVITGDRWVGVTGRPTLFCGAPARVRACASLADARLSTSGPSYFTAADWASFQAVASRSHLLSFGGDGYQYGLVASGGLDLVIESGLKLHDWAALCPVIEGAGGVVTDWAGRPPGSDGSGEIVAAGDRRCHAEAVAALMASRA